MNTQGKRQVGPRILINKTPFEAPKEEMSGAELKQLGGIPAGNKLFKEEPGPEPDRPIGDDVVVRLRDGDKFYDLPPGVVGGDRCTP